MRYLIIFLLALLLAPALPAQPNSIYNDDPYQKIPVGVLVPEQRILQADGGKVDKMRVEPPFWWVGMRHSKLEILFYDQNIRDWEPELNYSGVDITRVTRLENPNYLFVEITIGPGTRPGILRFQFKKGSTAREIPYELLARDLSADRVQGLDPSDHMYLLMPDRFANGDPSNDQVQEMFQSDVNRKKMFFRHGGDMQGILDKLDYLKSLHVTALWINPLLESNQPYESYHGYAFTDHYRIDPRYGDNALYKKLVEACHAKGIKVVMDIVHNHVGDQHWFIRDLPDPDWIHQFETFTRTTYREPVLMDPYVSEADKNRMTNGWFDHHMPDLNQRHPQLATYLIQNNIWWVEYSGLDAYRIDTYAYPDQAFMAEWAARLKAEFPNLFLFAETWVHGPAVQAQFTQNNDLRDGYNSQLPAVTDFQWHYGVLEALTQPQGWTNGIARLYYTLAQDFLYEDAYRNVIFLDNHDLPRAFSVLGEDMQKMKSALALLYTMRGIPCLYYGAEIGLKGFTDPDGKVRQDFPGGWKEDPINKFLAPGRTAEENELFTYIQKLAAYRANTPALQSGRLMQFIPVEGVYVYFRYDAGKTVMVALNTNDKEARVTTERFSERLDGFTQALDVLNGNKLNLDDAWDIPAYSAWVLELQF